MKKIIKHFLKIIINFCSGFYSYQFHISLKKFANIIYSIWLNRLFKNCGKNLCLQAPIYLIGGQYISIGDNFGALERCRLECWDSFAGEKFNPNLTIGSNVALGYNVHIGCINKIQIGNNVLMASNIFIEDCFHGYADFRDVNVAPVERKLYSKGPVIIGDNSWIGENVAIMPNVIIGENAIVGANSVVTKNVPAYSVVGGNPARVIRYLKESKLYP
jgi:acetyltransferase-like isoleucine patch superfamily enzyme